MFFEQAVYILCAVTSLACAWLLWAGYRRSGVRLLLWSSLCFIGLGMNNILLYLDLVVYPDYDLSLWRILPAFLGVVILLYGLIWDNK